MSVDLHIHTSASDGLIAPAQVVAAALDLHLSVIAITDHDTVAGVDEALAAAAATDIQVIPGVELSVLGPDGGDAHVLGLLVGHRSPRLVDVLRRLREARTVRGRLMVERLREGGHAVDFDEVLRQAGTGALGRVHIARALVAGGSVTTIEQAFGELIGRDGPFYVHKDTLAPSDALAAIHDAGGVAVLAHPGVSGEAALLPLIDSGLDGIEAYHAEHTPSQRQHFVSVAARHGLIVTGGSDFHGPGMRSAALGAGGCPDSAVEALKERATMLRP
jgi:3',5'-nucleoside bisphosphate phosphatase